MASATWTCADGHTHDVTKLGKGPSGKGGGDPTTTHDCQCSTSGDYVNTDALVTIATSRHNAAANTQTVL